MADMFALWRWQKLWEDRMLFVKAFGVTVELAVGGLILALILGFLVGILATTSSRFVRSEERRVRERV